MPRPFFTPGKEPVPIVQEAGWVPGLVWTCAENLIPNGIRSPDRPARSQSDVMDGVTNTSYLFVVRIHKAEFLIILRHFVYTNSL